jgi:hypothetical protein
MIQWVPEHQIRFFNSTAMQAVAARLNLAEALKPPLSGANRKIVPNEAPLGRRSVERAVRALDRAA